MFQKILIADRGEIATRIIKTCRKMGIRTITIYSEIEKFALHAKMADESYCIGPADCNLSYRNREAILTIAKKTGVDAIHPGYGFLAEDSLFAEMCLKNNIVFIGPMYNVMEMVCDKYRMKQIAKSLSVPVQKAYLIHNQVDLEVLIAELGYPVMVKTRNGGGGQGIQLITNKKDLERFQSSYSYADNTCYVEKFFPCAKHIEVQIIGDNSGKIYILGDRDCSIQIENKKMIEESPAFSLSEKNRNLLYEYTKRICQKVHYTNAGTVEFLVNEEEIIFLELNARIQVEHGITEMVTGLDIVEQQIRIAAKNQLNIPEVFVQSGHAIECRINAKTTGIAKYFGCKINDYRRFDHMLTDITVVSPYYDSLLGKAIVWDSDRKKAINKMLQFLEDICIYGIETNLIELKQIINHTEFIMGNYHTNFVKIIIEQSIRPNKHFSARDKIREIVDKDSFEEYYKKIAAKNCIQFEMYDQKLSQIRKKTGEIEAVIIGKAFIDGIACILIMMNPDFIMGSMGLAVGEKIARAFETAAETKLPVVSVTASGGARVQEGIFALFQMAKTADAVKRHSDKGLLYLSIISNPTLGGVSASFASLGDIILMEEDAIYGFTGKRIVEETVGKIVSTDFQTAPFHLKYGHIDKIIKKENLRNEIARILRIHINEIQC